MGKGIKLNNVNVQGLTPFHRAELKQRKRQGQQWLCLFICFSSESLRINYLRGCVIGGVVTKNRQYICLTVSFINYSYSYRYSFILPLYT